MQDALSDPATVEEMKKNDENVRLEVEEVNKLSRAKALEIYKDKTDLEQEVEEKLSKV
jgi:hypothetical protein